MNPLFIMALSNVVVAGLMAVLVFGISRVCRRPAIVHSLWLLVLLKLITPPVFTVPLSVPQWSQSSARAEDEASRPATAERRRPGDRRLIARADEAAANTPEVELPYQSARTASTAPIKAAPAAMPLAERNAETKAEFLVDPGPPVMVRLPEGGVTSAGSDQMSESGTRKPEVGGRRSEVGGQKSEVSGRTIGQSDRPNAQRSESPAVTPSPPHPLASSPRHVLIPIVVTIWFVGTAVLVLWAAIRVMLFRNLLRRAEPASPELQRESDELAKTMGLAKRPQVRMLPGAVTPMLWAGLGRPILLFPRELLARTDTRSRAMLLMHELAHMRRGDHWVRFLELLAFCLYWWNPVVWLAKREIHRTEEECCDALVVEHSTDRGRGYANALLDTLDFLAEAPRGAARGLCPPVASGIGRVDFIKRRLTMILSGSIRGRMSKFGRLLVLASAVCILPLLPVLGDGGDAPSEDSKQTAKDGAASTAVRSDRSPKAKPESGDSRPTVGQLEPTDFENTPRSLQFDPLEVRSVAISKDGKWMASGHGRWTTAGMVRIWDFKTKKEVHAFPETKGIASVVFSPDGKYFASAGWERKLIIRDTKEFKVLHEIPLGNVARLAFSPDSKTLASVTESAKLQLWNPQTGKEYPALKGTFFRMQTVAFSPDGRYIAVGGGKFDNPRNGRVSAWDLKTGKQIKVIENLSAPVIDVAFSPDSKSLAVGGFDRMIHVYNSGSLALQRSLRGHTQYVENVTFSPDGKRLVSTSYDQTIRLWDTSTGDQLTALNGHNNGTLCAAFSKDGKTLITGGIDKTLKVWDPVTYRQTQTIQPGADHVEFPEPVLAVAYSPNGALIASAHEDKTVRIRDASTGGVVRTLAGHDDVVSQLVFSPNGETLATASYDNNVKLWNVADGKEIRTFTGHTNWVFAVAFSPDGKRLATSGYDKTIRLWNVADGKPLAELKGHFATVRSVAFSPDGKELVSGSGDRTLKVWDLKTKKAVHTLKGHKGTVRDVAWSPDGTTIASAGEDNAVKLWDAGSGAEKSTLTGHSGMVWCLAFSPRGQVLASGGFDNRIMIWNPKTGQRRKTLSGHSDVITSLAFEPGMKGLISGSYDKTLRFWTAKQPPIPELLTLAVSPEDVRAVAFSPDGRYMAVAGHDRVAKMWDLKTGRLVHVLRGHTGGIRTVAFSPNSKLLATGSWDNLIHVWNVETGKSIARFGTRKDKHNVSTVVFAPDSRHVVSGGFDKTVRVWDLDSRKFLWKSDPHELEVMGVDVSPDGKTVVSATGFYKRKNDPGQITFWDLKSGKIKHRMPGPKDAKMVEFSPDGGTVMVGSGDSSTPIWLIDVKTKQKTNGPAGFRATYLPDGKTIGVCKGPGRQVYVYDLEARREVARFVGHPDVKGSIYNIAASPDGSVLVSIGTGGTIKLWPLRAVPALKSSLTITAHKGASRFALMLADDKRIVSGGHDHLVKVFDRQSGKLLKTLKGHQGGVTCGALSPDGSLLATGSWDKTVRLWNVRSLEPADIVLKHKGEIVALRFTKDGRHLITAGRTNMLQLWVVKSGKLLRSSKPQEKPIADFDVSPDEKQIAAVVSDWKKPAEAATVKLFRFSDFKDMKEVASHDGELKSVRFRRDGKRLLVAGRVGITVVDPATGKRLQTIRPPYGVPRTTFVGKEGLIASGGWTGEVALWNPQTGSRIAAGTEHSQYILGLRLARDGQTLLSTGQDGTIRVWPVPGDNRPSLAETIRRWNTPRAVPQLSPASGAGTRLLIQNSMDRVYFGVTSPDNQLLAVGRTNGTVTLYDAQSLDVVRQLNGHEDTVRSGVFSHDGQALATGGDDKSIRLWDVKTGAVKVMKGHEERVNSLLFTPNDKQVVSCDLHGDIKVWDVKSALCVATFRNAKGGLRTLALSPDGNLLAAGGQRTEIDLWDLPGRKLVGTLKGHKGRILSLAFSPDGRTLVSGDAGEDQTDVIKVWDVPSRTLRTSLGLKTSMIVAASFSPDGRLFATAGKDTNLRFWDTATGQLLASVPSGHRGTVRNIEWSRDGSQLVTTGWSGTAKRWSLSAGRQLWMPGYTTMLSSRLSFQRERNVASHPPGAWFATFSPDGKLLATGGEDATAKVWDTHTWKVAIPPIKHRGTVLSAAFSPDGTFLATCDNRGEVVLTSRKTGKRLHTLPGHKDMIRKVAFTPDGKQLVSGSKDGTARIWDVTSGKLLKKLDLGLSVWGVAVSPDGRLLALGTGNWNERRQGGVSVWNLQSGRRVKTLFDDEAYVHSLAYVSNEKLAIGCAGGRGGVGVSLWNVKTGKRISVLHWPPTVRLVRVSRDGKYLAAAHGGPGDGQVAVWNVTTGEQVGRFQVTEKYLFSAEFSPDGKRIATASKGGAVTTWRLVDDGK